MPVFRASVTGTQTGSHTGAGVLTGIHAEVYEYPKILKGNARRRQGTPVRWVWGRMRTTTAILVGRSSQELIFMGFHASGRQSLCH